MNYKGFKKVHEDNDRAVFHNDSGHAITIAKKALSKKYLEKLKDIPMHKAEGGSADSYTKRLDWEKGINRAAYPADVPEPGTSVAGHHLRMGKPDKAKDNLRQTLEQMRTTPKPKLYAGGSNDGPVGDDFPDIPTPKGGQTVADNTTPAPTPAQADTAPMTDDGSQDAAPAQPMPTAQVAANAPPAPMAQPQPQATPPMTPQQAKHEEVKSSLLNTADSVEQDLNKGHITPESYSQLFAKKDTLGKIGTLFGLLVSGAGSGITGQPNAVMEMMSKEINNDLDAQKASASNRQNLIKLNLQDQMQKGQLGEILARTDLTNAQKSGAIAESKIKTNAAAMITANQFAFHHLVEAAKGTGPNSPENQTLASVYPLMKDKVLSIADQAAASVAAQNWNPVMQGGGQGGGAGSQQLGAIDYNHIQKLRRDSQMGILGAPSEGELGQLNQEAGKVSDIRALRSQWLDSFNKLDQMAFAGKLNKGMHDAESKALGAKLATETAHRYVTGEAAAQAQGMLPSETDIGGQGSKVRQEKLRKGLAFFDGLEAGTPMLDQFGGKIPPSHPGLQSAEKAQARASANKKQSDEEYPLQFGAKYNNRVGIFSKNGDKFLRWQN